MEFQTEKDKEKVKKVSKFVEKTTGKTIEEFLKTRKWKDKTIARHLFENNIDDTDKKQLQSKITNEHVLDNRTHEEYALNVALSWFIEDAIIEILNKNGINAEKMGTDKDRSFDVFSSDSPDIYIPEKDKYFEIITNYANAFISRKTIALRDNKYENLKMFESGIIIYDFPSNRFFVSNDVSKETVLKKAYNNSFGKITTNVSINDSPLDINDFIRKMKEVS